jgi:hypothetical protein
VTLPTEFLLYVADILERLGIPYHVGGSIASSERGEKLRTCEGPDA